MLPFILERISSFFIFDSLCRIGLEFHLTTHTATSKLPEMQASISLSIRIAITQYRHVFSGLCVNFVFVSTVCFCCSDLYSLDLWILIL